MNRFKFKTTTIASLLILSLSGCDSIPFINSTSDYKTAGRSRPLEVPPDLTSVSANDTYSVPGGSTSYSSFSQGQTEQVAIQEKILPNPENVRLERAGSQRWLVVQAAPEKIWPVIRDFWTELGFAVRVENAQTGVMETEWVDVSSLTKDSGGNYLSKFQGWLDKLNTIKDRQKFRTRIDRGTDNATTEIYMSHRSMSDVPDDGKTRVRTVLGTIETGYAPENKNTRSQTENERANAEDLDAELLRRLMVRLGVEEQSKAVLASANNEQRAVLDNDSDGTLKLSLNDPFDRAWRRVGLALDRVGFVVEDKDRSKGLFYVRYSNTDTDEPAKEKKGFLSSLKFWGDDDKTEAQNKPKPIEPKKTERGLTDKLKFWRADDKDKVNLEKQYRVKVENGDKAGSIVTITDAKDDRDRSSTANKIIKLLFEQLK
jgi:outer membrane protein assembly factor BamC